MRLPSLLESWKERSLEDTKVISTFYPKSATCYKCGITGHIAAECKVKTGETSQIDKVVERVKKYRHQYLKLKKGNSESQPKKQEKALFAKEWFDEDLSADDDDVEDKCLMVTTSESQFDIDVREVERTNLLKKKLIKC